ncbi:ABC transporter substrate-binding protein [Arthrobacter castelli]|uniref:ABC transporter substrate-binding protein n=1 Tax=Arthrobacter castelli TaxID=271431 RepID=UPI00042A6C00|nr:ABC transporter substrate-binding protein [Arthrobacter castelli]
MKNKLSISGLALVAVMTISACSNPGATSPTGGASAPDSAPKSGAAQQKYETDPDIASMVPEEYQERGSFKVSINPDVPPVKFVNSAGEITGFAPDLLRAAGQVMGLEVNIQKGSFDSMVPGLEAKRFDVIGSIGDYEERRTNIDFIDYMQSGTGIMVSADFEKDKVASPAELCGASIAFIVGTRQQGLIQSASEKCEEKGEAPIKGIGYKNGAAAVLAVKSGQDDAAWIDAPSILYNVRQNPETFKTLWLQPDPGVYGIGVHKDNADFREALRAALLKLVETGAYRELISSYGLEDLALPKIPVNSGGPLAG